MATQIRSQQPASLVRQLGLASATALVISNMVGTGIFATTGFMAGALGDARLILLCWFAGGLFALAGALSYSELGVNFPSSGGEYVYLTEAFGPTWGFLTGWNSFFAGFSGPIAAAALAFADYLGFFYEPLRPANSVTLFGSGTLTLKFGGAQVLACVLIGGFTLINCISVARTAWVQNALTTLKVVVILTFVGLGFAFGTGSWSHLAETTTRTSTNALPAEFIVQLLWVMVGYSGWNAATYVAGEIRDPERTLPRALALGTLAVTALFLGLNLIFLYAAPVSSLKGVLAVGSLAAQNLFGSRIAGVYSALMALAIMSTVNAMITVGPRVYFAMARNRLFLPMAGEVHPRFRTPMKSVLLQGLCAALMTLTPFPQLIVFIGFSLTLFTLLSAAAVLVMRRREGWRKLPAVSFAYPLVPVSYILLGTAMMVYGLIWQPVATLTALAVLAIGGIAQRTLRPV